MRNNYSQSNSLEFREIVLTHLKRILELSSHELKATERLLIVDNQKSFVESENTQMSYIQAIENLAYVLLPYFDSKMTTAFDENILFLQGFAFEIIKKIDDDDLKTKLDELEGEEKKDFLIMIQIKRAKLLFIELNKLLKRVDYLRTSVFGDDDVIEGDD